MSNIGAEREIFGQVRNGPEAGQSAYRVRLTGGGLSANIITWGAAIQDLRLKGHAAPLVLGFNSFDHYPDHSPHFGATAGRFANRLGNAGFEIDGHRFNTDPNNAGKHTLHGGSRGYGKRLWQIADLGTSHVYLTLHDEAGTMGFPGTCEVTCGYTLKDDGILHVAYTTRTDAPTVAGLAHHSYFTLDGSADCRDHTLQILADTYLPVDSELIPTGVIEHVGEGPFDFRNPRTIHHGLDDGIIYDHNFCLATRRRGLQDVAVARSEQSGITLTVATTEPGLQFYAGHKINTPVPGLTGQAYGAHAGFCLETQNWPDAPNHSHFPTALLRPGDELRQVTEYRFAKN